MVACLESLSLAPCSNTITSVASLVLEASESDKDGEFPGKIQFLHYQHSHAMETNHCAQLFAAVDRPRAQLVCVRTASPALALPCSWTFPMKITQNDEVQILTVEPNERGDCT